jgi:hypothetical protein
VNATSTAVARIAGVAIVLILAAALGLIVGNALNARASGAEAGAAGASLPHMSGFDGARYAPQQREAAGPGLPHMSGFDGARYQTQQREAAVIPQTWGNVDERHDASSSEQASARESLTAPTPR